MTHANQSYELQVLVHGKPVTVYPHEDKSFIWGETGTEFALKVWNNIGRRVGAVITVDGLSVMNGNPGSYDIGGYAVPPCSAVEIPGWRLDQKKIAQFFFAQFEKSYAALMGMPQNVGVIGCAIFNEAPRVSVLHPTTDLFRYLAPPALHSYGDSGLGLTRGGGSGIGTGFGQERGHAVTTVEFIRADVAKPDMLLAIHYGTKTQLALWRVPLKQPLQVAGANPFPGEAVGCPPPPHWRGQESSI